MRLARHRQSFIQHLLQKKNSSEGEEMIYNKADDSQERNLACHTLMFCGYRLVIAEECHISISGKK